MEARVWFIAQVGRLVLMDRENKKSFYIFFPSEIFLSLIFSLFTSGHFTSRIRHSRARERVAIFIFLHHDGQTTADDSSYPYFFP
jgi:hypothetical protein